MTTLRNLIDGGRQDSRRGTPGATVHTDGLGHVAARPAS